MYILKIYLEFEHCISENKWHTYTPENSVPYYLAQSYENGDVVCMHAYIIPTQ